MSFLARSPSPFHAVHSVATELLASGFEEFRPERGWISGGAGFIRRSGALVAWVDGGAPSSPFRLVGAHTDSPNLRLKPRPDCGSAGWRQLGIEVYGGALWNSWLDRDLGLSGRVVVTGEGGPETHLLLVDRPLARVPQLAIHLDRDVNGQGLKLNPQVHLNPVWGSGIHAAGDLVDFVAGELAVSPGDVVAWDLMFHDVCPPALLGRDGEFLVSSRLDNLVSCWAGTRALLDLGAGNPSGGATSVLCLFDHEEVGSTSSTGADGALLTQVLELIVLNRGGDRRDLLRALADSFCVSVDMAHATHPNYPERHDPSHPVTVNAGPVVKVNSSQRYATDAVGHAMAVDACRRAGVPHQVFVGRNDQPCGSTIGPLTAANLGIGTVDVGVAQLSMHSAREMCGAEDPDHLAAMLGAWYRG